MLQEMTSVWKKLRDVTWPNTALFSGEAFNSGILKVFSDKEIEVRFFLEGVETAPGQDSGD